MSDLSPAQNARLRKALWESCNEHFGGKITPFGKAIGVLQPALSRIMNKEGGAAISTAHKFATYLRVDVSALLGPYDYQPGEAVAHEESAPAAAPAFDPTASQFLARFNRHRQLEDLIIEHEGRWKLQTVVQGLFSSYERDANGEPVGGWMALLDGLRNAHTNGVAGPTTSAKPVVRKRFRRP